MGHGDGHGTGSGDARGKTQRVAVPAMPMPLAILCCILNFLVPGLGTIIAGFGACCCSRNEDMSTGSRVGSCCISFGIGFLQLLTTALLLLGWLWSCVWGVFFLGMSSEYYHDNPPDGGTVLHPGGGQATVVIQPGNPGYHYGYPSAQPAQPFPGFSPQQQQYHDQPQQYPYPGPQPQMGYGEPPPPYTERETMPSAPPEFKVNL